MNGSMSRRRFSRERGHPARPGRRPRMNNQPKARGRSSGQDARAPGAHTRSVLSQPFVVVGLAKRSPTTRGRRPGRAGCPRSRENRPPPPDHPRDDGVSAATPNAGCLEAPPAATRRRLTWCRPRHDHRRVVRYPVRARCARSLLRSARCLKPRRSSRLSQVCKAVQNGYVDERFEAASDMTGHGFTTTPVASTHASSV